MKKYTTDWKGIIIFFTFVLGGLFLSFYLQIQEGTYAPDTFLGSALISGIPIIIGVIFATVYSYALIDGRTLRYVYFLYQRRTIDIDSITNINDQATFKVAKSQFRSLYVFYKDKTGDAKWIEFRITIFPERTLGRLIKDLKAINPRIELDSYAERLMHSAR